MARVCVPAGALPRWTDRWTRVGSQEAAKGCGHLSLLWLHPSQPLLGRLQGRAGFFWGGLCGGFVAVPTAALETEPQLVCGGRSGASGAFSSFSLLSLCLSLVPRCALTGGSRNSSPREERTQRQGCCQPQHPRGQQGWEAGSRGGTEGTEQNRGFLWRRGELAQLINVTFTPSCPCRAARGKSPLWPAPRGRMGPPKGEGQLLGSPNPVLLEHPPPTTPNSEVWGKKWVLGVAQDAFCCCCCFEGESVFRAGYFKAFFFVLFKKKMI